jgi:hypothetical protein
LSDISQNKLKVQPGASRAFLANPHPLLPDLIARPPFWPVVPVASKKSSSRNNDFLTFLVRFERRRLPFDE